MHVMYVVCMSMHTIPIHIVHAYIVYARTHISCDAIFIFCILYFIFYRAGGIFYFNFNEQVHRFLGLSVGLIQSSMPEAQRKEAYSADVTYSTNQELGFDYLRDHLTVTKDGTGSG